MDPPTRQTIPTYEGDHRRCQIAHLSGGEAKRNRGDSSCQPGEEPPKTFFLGHLKAPLGPRLPPRKTTVCGGLLSIPPPPQTPRSLTNRRPDTDHKDGLQVDGFGG